MTSSIYMKKHINRRKQTKNQEKPTTEKRKRVMPEEIQGSWYLHTM